MAKVQKAVVAAAGFGTRFLPQTKAMPKEMLPLVDKPIIQYVVEELVEAGIEDIIIITGYHKRSIEDHFDETGSDLRDTLIKSGKLDLLDDLSKISNLANIAYVRQKGPYGTATPIINAAHLLGNEPFIYTFADDLIVSKPNRFKQMVDVYEELESVIIPCIKATKDEDYDRYGIMSGEETSDGKIKVNKIVEKPGVANAPSNLASVGGFVLTPQVIEYAQKALENLPDDKEFYLNEFVIEAMIEDGVPVFAHELRDSEYFDTGTKLEYLKTAVSFALRHPDIKDDFANYLRDLKF